MSGAYQTVDFLTPFRFSVPPETWALAIHGVRTLQFAAARNAADTLVFELPTAFGIANKGLAASLVHFKAKLQNKHSVTIGGRKATEFDAVMPNVARGFGVPIFSDPEGTYFESARSRLRLIEVPLERANMVIAIDAPSPEEFEIVAGLAEQFLSTVTFEN